MNNEKKPICHFKIGGYYLREIKDFADLTFGEFYLNAILDKRNNMFEVWIKDGCDTRMINKFESKFKQCVLRVFEEKTKNKK